MSTEDASSQPPQRLSLLSYPALPALVVQAVFGFAFSAYLILPKYLVQELHAGPSVVGWVSTSENLAAVLALPLVAGLSDRLGRRNTLVIACLLECAAALAYLLVNEVGPLIYALRALQGVSFLLEFSAIFALIGDIAPKAQLGQMMGYFGLAFLVSNALSPAVGEWIAIELGWGALFWMAGAAALLAAGVSSTLPNHVASAPNTHPAAPTTGTVGARLGWKLRLLLASAAGGVGLGTMFVFTGPYALERGADEVRSFFIAYTVAAMAVRLGLSGVADRFGKRRTAVITFTLYGLTVMATALLSAALLPVFGFAFGLAHGLGFPFLAALLSEASAPHERGALMSYFSASFKLGIALATFSLGPLAELAGYPPIYVIAGLVTLGAPAMLLRPPAEEMSARLLREAAGSAR